MPRAKRGFKARRRRNKVLKQAKGYYGARSRAFRTAQEVVDKAGQNAYIGRKKKKREYRQLWSVRISASTKPLGVSYSKLMGQLAKKNIKLNRKMLSEIAIKYPKDFQTIVNLINS